MSSSKLFKKVDSSDYIAAKRQMAIYKEFANPIINPIINPIKNNGYNYNINYKFIPTTQPDASNNCLKFSQSYELQQNFNKGKNYKSIVCAMPN